MVVQVDSLAVNILEVADDPRLSRETKAFLNVLNSGGVPLETLPPLLAITGNDLRFISLIIPRCKSLKASKLRTSENKSAYRWQYSSTKRIVGRASLEADIKSWYP